MISRFFGWLGHLIAVWAKHLADLISSWLGSFFSSCQGLLNWGADFVNNTAGDIVTECFSVLPPDSPSTRAIVSGVSIFRSCWVVGDAFVPLSEGLFLVTAYFTFYITLKSIMFIVRVILDLF